MDRTADAGVCFILPAMLIVTVCAWAYAAFGSLPQIQGVLYGVKPVIIAVVLQALWALARAAIKDKFLAAIGVVAAAAALAGANLLTILVAAGIVNDVARVERRTPPFRKPGR